MFKVHLRLDQVLLWFVVACVVCAFFPAWAGTDGDGVSDPVDNCVTVPNPDQADQDLDGLGDACDTCPYDPGNDADGDGICGDIDNCSSGSPVSFDFETGGEQGWTHDPTNGADTWLVRNASCFGDPYPSNMFSSNGNAGPGCVLDSSREQSRLLSPPILLPPVAPISVEFDALSFDEGGACEESGDVDAKDFGVTTDGGQTFTLLNDCTALADGQGNVLHHQFNLSAFAGQQIQLIFLYRTRDAFHGHTFAVDNFVFDWPYSNEGSQQDTDGDGIGDPCDACPTDPTNDLDADGVCGVDDNCSEAYNPDQADSDGNGVGDACDADQDGDGVGDETDNCVAVVNPSQADADTDGIGDLCDPCPLDLDNDGDGDGVCGDVDNCVEVSNAAQIDGDADGWGDACDLCPGQFDPDQADLDADGVGDLCDLCPADADPAQSDGDLDGVGDLCDNCLSTRNPTQGDFDNDLEGDRCDLDDGMIYAFFHDPSFMDWQPEAGFDSWNVIKGDLALLRFDGLYYQEPGSNILARTFCGVTSTWIADPASPPLHMAAFYLTSGMSGAQEGGIGAASNGTPRGGMGVCP